MKTNEAQTIVKELTKTVEKINSMVKEDYLVRRIHEEIEDMETCQKEWEKDATKTDSETYKNYCHGKSDSFRTAARWLKALLIEYKFYNEK